MSDPTTTPAAPAAKPKLTKYTYDGPVSGATIPFGSTAEGTPDVRDVQLHPGFDVELPADDDHVKALVELGYLKAATPAAKADTKKGGDK